MTACPIQTEMQEHRFVCELRAGHDGDHVWWLAAPVNTWIEMPSPWTRDLLVEDGDPPIPFVPASGIRSYDDPESNPRSTMMGTENESGPGAGCTAPDPANPELTGADNVNDTDGVNVAHDDRGGVV